MVETSVKNDHSRVVIFVVGTTGVGKSKLALDLARLYDGEIVNADSMQVYKGNGCGVMTACPTEEDYASVPHHCYACVDMLEKEKHFNVQQYRAMSLAAIEQIHSRGKVPIVCGGTNYYVEALLFRNEAESSVTSYDDDGEDFLRAFELKRAELLLNPRLTEIDGVDELLNTFMKCIPTDGKQEIEDGFESELCHALLEQVDPEMAQMLHSRDKRKIVNALFKFFKSLTLKDDSAVASIKQSEVAARHLQLRFLPIIVWIKADIEILEQRISKRVRKMVSTDNEGLQEAFDVFKQFETSNGQGLDFTKGILQAIGYKEFYHFYKQVNGELAAGPYSIQYASQLDTALDTLSAKTVQYAAYQAKWLSKRIYPVFCDQDPESADDKWNLLHRITLNDAARYEEVALAQASDFVKKMTGRYRDLVTEGEHAVSEFMDCYCCHVAKRKEAKVKEWKKFYCEACGVEEGKPLELNGQHEWNKHKKTRKHQSKVKQQKKAISGMSDIEFYAAQNLKRKSQKPVKSAVSVTGPTNDDFCTLFE